MILWVFCAATLNAHRVWATGSQTSESNFLFVQKSTWLEAEHLDVFAQPTEQRGSLGSGLITGCLQLLGFDPFSLGWRDLWLMSPLHCQEGNRVIVINSMWWDCLLTIYKSVSPTFTQSSKRSFAPERNQYSQMTPLRLQQGWDLNPVLLSLLDLVFFPSYPVLHGTQRGQSSVCLILLDKIKT